MLPGFNMLRLVFVQKLLALFVVLLCPFIELLPNVFTYENALAQVDDYSHGQADPLDMVRSKDDIAHFPHEVFLYHFSAWCRPVPESEC